MILGSSVMVVGVAVVVVEVVIVQLREGRSKRSSSCSKLLVVVRCSKSRDAGREGSREGGVGGGSAVDWASLIGGDSG